MIFLITEIDSCKEKQNEIDTEELHTSKKKKKKRDKSNRGEEGDITSNSLNTVTEYSNTRKRKKKNIAEEESVSDEDKACNGRIPVKKSKKKKRKREAENEESEGLAKSEVQENGKCSSVKKKRNQACESSTKTEKKDRKCDGNSENNLTKKQKRAKMEDTQCVGNLTEESVDLEDIKRYKDCEDTGSSENPEKRKKKKKHKKIVEKDMKPSLTLEDDGPLTNGSSCQKKKKKNKRSSEDAADEPSSKRRKDDQTREDTNGADVQGSDPAYSGQWNTASLGDEQRQNKFLRLLGGFKAAKSGNSPLLTLEKKSSNVAMTQNQEGIYMRNMENQYSKAMSFNKSRGLGLGFEKPPSEGKKFYIDKTVSKSKKFDD